MSSNLTGTGLKIAMAMGKANMSRDELASACEVTSQTVWNWTNNKRTPSDAMKIKIAKALNSTVTEIFFA